MKSVRPLDRFPLVNTCNLDEARAAVARIYAAPKFEVMGRERSLHAIINLCQLRNLRVSYGSYSASLHMQFPETSFATQMFLLGGKSEAVLAGRSETVTSDRSLVISPNETLSVNHDSDYERLVLSVNSTSLANTLSVMTGESCAAPVKFEPVQDYSLPAADALRRHLLFFVERINAFQGNLPDFVIAELEQTLLVMFLLANRHNYFHKLERASLNAAAAQVRRTEEYIEANWQLAITLENLAEVSGVSALSLLRSFQKSRGYSPMQFVNKVRLNHARELLRCPNAGTTVAAVASTCGFADYGRFANEYVRAFGEHPSRTLDRSHGAARYRH